MDDDDRQQWIEAAAAAMRAALADPAVRADVARLLVGDAQDVKRRRRLGELREELAGFAVTWRRTEGES